MAAPPRIGDVIAGKYRIERALGRGGMGVVFAARHVQLRERVAIKLLVDRRGDYGDLVARFVREGRASMRIRSEHAVRVHDIGALETGEPFLVMEYLEGRDLAAVLAREGPLPVDAAVEYVLQAIEAIAEAHARGIVHRDIKPSNLFLSHRADGSPVVKVLDFGIAKTTGAGADASGTDTGAPVGTPVYMAPEQMRSRAAVDARTDVWALGVTLYALLTGAPPFPAGSLLEIHEGIVRGAPPLRDRRPDAPAALEAVLRRCMQKEPDDRFANVADVAAALAEIAPEHARVSALRAAKTLEAAPLVEETQGAPAGDTDIAPGTSSAAAITRTAAEASWHDAAPGSLTTGSRTGASPPVTTVAPARARPAWQRGAALAGAAMAGGIVALAALGVRRPAPSPGAGAMVAGGDAPAVSSAPVPAPAPVAASSPAPEAEGRWRPPAPGVSSEMPAAPAAPGSAAPSRAPGRAPQRAPAEARATGAPKPPASPPTRPRDPLADPD